MTDKEKLSAVRAKIEMRKESLKPHGGQGLVVTRLMRELCDDFLSIIDSMQEEPVSEDLGQAIDTYLATYFGGEKEKRDWPFLKKMAIHFANWQKQQMEKKAFPVEIGRMRSDYKCMLHGNFSNCNTGDKVKVIIIQKE